MVTNDTLELQRQIDLYDNVDLGGANLLVDYVVVNPLKHNGLRLHNGTIRAKSALGRDPRYGVFELVKNASWRGVSYPDAPLNVTMDNLTVYGGWSNITSDITTNAKIVTVQGYNFAAVNAVAGRVDSLSVRNSRFYGLQAGLLPQQTQDFTVEDVHFGSIAEQCIGSIYDPDNPIPSMHSITDVWFDDVGSMFNFSAPPSKLMTPAAATPRAQFMRFFGVNVRGRTKIHGPWWTTIKSGTVAAPINAPTQYSAFSFPAGKAILVDDVEMRGFLVGGLTAPVGNTVHKPSIQVVDSKVFGGQMAFNCDCPLILNNVEIHDCYRPWGATPPASTSRVSQFNGVTATEQAQRFLLARETILEWNRLYGTTYDPLKYCWLSGDVKKELTRLIGIIET